MDNNYFEITATADQKKAFPHKTVQMRQIGICIDMVVT